MDIAPRGVSPAAFATSTKCQITNFEHQLPHNNSDDKVAFKSSVTKSTKSHLKSASRSKLASFQSRIACITETHQKVGSTQSNQNRASESRVRKSHRAKSHHAEQNFASKSRITKLHHTIKSEQEIASKSRIRTSHQKFPWESGITQSHQDRTSHQRITQSQDEQIQTKK